MSLRANYVLYGSPQFRILSDKQSEKHTLKHFRKFWAPTLFDRSVVKTVKCGLNEFATFEKTL